MSTFPQIVCVRLYSGAGGQAKRSSNSINSSSFMRFRKWNFLDKKHLSSCITGQKQSFPWILGNRLGCASEVGAASFGWTLALKPVGLRSALGREILSGMGGGNIGKQRVIARLEKPFGQIDCWFEWLSIGWGCQNVKIHVI